MGKTTKGAVAAAAAGVLLLGGAGTLAYWSDSETVTGGTLNSGHLDIATDGTNTGCGAWELDSGESAPVTYTAGDPLVPGDVLSRSCAYTIDAAGNHLRATISATAPSLTGDLANSLTVGTANLEVNGASATEFTEANDGQALTVDVTVTFNSTVTDDEDVSAVLGDITVTAQQVHN
jgi:alternate signal-mediated exported protein